MRKQLCVTALAFLAVSVAVFLLVDREEPRVVSERETVHLRYGFLLKNTTNEYIPDSGFSMFIPLETGDLQRISDFSVNAAVEHKEDEYGHSAFDVKVGGIPPYGAKNVSATFELSLAKGARPSSLQDPANYLGDEPFLDMDSPAVKRLAAQFSTGTTTERAQSIYAWLVNNIATVGYVAEDKGAEYAIKTRKGDCTEYMHAFIALARLNGIPARGLGGFFIDGNAALVRAHDYHNWAEFYDGEQWLIVDPKEQIFSDLGAKRYIRFRHISGNQPGDTSYSQRFLSFSPKIAVTFQ